MANRVQPLPLFGGQRPRVVQRRTSSLIKVAAWTSTLGSAGHVSSDEALHDVGELEKKVISALPVQLHPLTHRDLCSHVRYA